MRLHCTLVRGPGASRAGPPLELTIEAPPGSGGSVLQRALTTAYLAGDVSVQGVRLSMLAVGIPPLVNGAVLVDGAGGQARRGNGSPASALMLAVHSGPGAGTVLPLKRGTHRIGRSGAEISIPDPALSREHARLEVSEAAILIVDAGSANGTRVDGKRVSRAAVSTKSLISCGNSTLSIVFGPPGGAAGPEWDSAGSNVSEPVKVPRGPENSGRIALIATAVLPLLIGVSLALITGMWMFLAFTAVSAFSVLVPAVAGRRQRRQLRTSVAAAVQQDKERRRRSAPSAAELALRADSHGSAPPADPGPSSGIWLRLGLAPQPANVSLDPADPGYEPPELGWVPLTLRPSELTTVRGPGPDATGLIRSFIMQFTGYPLAAGTRILIHGEPGVLPLPARFLRRVSLSSTVEKTAADIGTGHGRGCDRGVLILIDDGPPAAGIARLVTAAISLGWQVIHCSQAEPVAAGPVIELGGSMARLRAGGSATDFVPDLAPEEVFDRYCRRLASDEQSRPRAEAGVPVVCGLADLVPLSAADTLRRWAAGRRGRGLQVPIGMAASGRRLLDLESDGPHLLVAGTTGSGKSELLRSLTSALALSYPPDRISFLFIDFKGGSGLGPLTGLPHCVGMLTDLTRHELDRSLVSLRAEIRRREEILSAVQSPDLRAYRETAEGQARPLPQLILIIDEFRMLVEEAPGALVELMRIAAIGRSLGIHLIMATQRPQGALTADIRANVTTSIALRVQSEMESADIINSKAAAGIAVTSPGRAFFARGTEEPDEFQAASLTGVTAAVTDPGVTVALALDALKAPVARPDRRTNGSAAPTPAQAAGPIVESLVSLWAGLGGSPAHRPVAEPLPSVIPYPGGECSPALDGEAGGGGAADGGGGTNSVERHVAASVWSVQLGWADQPDRQRIALLAWQPAGHGHLGLVGATGAGVGDAMELAVRQLMDHDVESHIYILDAGSSFSGATARARVGAVAGLHELRRGVRILERIARELSLRLSRPHAKTATPIVLALSGWGSWVSAFRAGPLMWAEDLVQDIVRDGARAGITVVVSGGRELVTARFFATVPNRAYFPAGSSEESRLAWPRLPGVAQVRGRSVVFGAIVGGSTSVAQFYAPRADAPELSGSGKPARAAPFKVEPLPSRFGAADVRARFVAAEAQEMTDEGHEAPIQRPRRRGLLIGIGGDELSPATVRLPAGSVLAVLGGPGSGKSSLIAALPELNPHVAEWLRPGPEDAAENYWAAIRAEAAADRLSREAMLLADDADMLSPVANRHLLELHSLGWAVILTAGFSPAIVQRVPVALDARSHGAGVLICPRSIMDGDFFGLRFEVEADPPPGRAVLFSDGRSTPVQLAAPGPGSQRGRWAAGA